MTDADALLLAPDRPLRLDRVRHGELRVIAGVVWITAGGEARDRFLGPGERYPLPRTGIVLAEAVRGSARVELVVAPRWRRLWPALAARCRLLWPGAAAGA